MANPTYDGTYTRLSKISDIVNRALRDMGKIEGKNALGSDEELRYLVLDISKKICENLPSTQFENDAIEDAEVKLCHALNKLADLEDYK